MAHLIKSKKQLLTRIHRIQGQLRAVEEMLNETTEDTCADILQLIAACRGAIHGLMAELLEEHVLHHASDSKTKKTDELKQVLKIIKTYLK